MMKALTSALVFGLLAVSPASLAQPAQPETFTAAQLAADLEEWENWLFATHPDPGFSMDVAAVEARFDAIRAELDDNYTRREAWLALSPLNPLFADGHITLRLPGDDYQAYLDAGGAEFTLPVRLSAEGLQIAPTVAESAQVEAGSRIDRINGQEIAPLMEAALSRIHGDSDGLRRHLLETRFSQYLWALTGGADIWVLNVTCPDGSRRTIRLDPSRDVADADHATSSLEFRGNAAVLILNSFMPDQTPDFHNFVDEAFAEIDERGTDVLVIDISENGGGAHMLSDHLLNYLTTQRHTPLSAVTARITPENQALIPGSEIGQVISMPFAQWVEPPADWPHRFDGRFAFLVGAGSYSQSIVLAATVQDFGIAPVAGPGTEGRANSTGQVQLHPLTETGLEAVAPIYVFTRASGDMSADPIIPDIPLSGSREEQIEALIGILRSTH
ncbi:S41 family peptidase [Maricaulis parjimensis]|uniref:S41 family peptidase n=1 Tax=Maricaulis parjimensis TaxID=144023 RepID=UPI00193A38F8|nr:S41 family peptidase [Maricaulis parjimensis]